MQKAGRILSENYAEFTAICCTVTGPVPAVAGINQSCPESFMASGSFTASSESCCQGSVCPAGSKPHSLSGQSLAPVSIVLLSRRNQQAEKSFMAGFRITCPILNCLPWILRFPRISCCVFRWNTILHQTRQASPEMNNCLALHTVEKKGCSPERISAFF